MDIPCDGCICLASCKSEYYEQFKKAPHNTSNLIRCRTMLYKKCDILLNFLSNNASIYYVEAEETVPFRNKFHKFFQEGLEVNNEDREDITYEQGVPIHY